MPAPPVADTGDFSEAADFLADTGLASNGQVPVYYGEHEEKGVPYELKSIAWRLLEDRGVAIVAYNTPKSLHCLSPNQQVETFLILEHAKRDPRVRAVVWTGTGTKAFGSGAALRGDMKVYVPGEVVRAYGARNMAPVPGDWVLTNMTKAFWDFPKPLVFAVNGMAVGGAANIALANFGDIVLCSNKARFMYPFAKLGLTPELGSSLVLPFLVGMAKTKEMMMLGEWFSAADALRLGLVNQVLPPEQLLPRAVAVATKLAAFHPAAMRLSKRVLNAPLRDQLDAILAREQVVISEAMEQAGILQLKAKL